MKGVVPMLKTIYTVYFSSAAMAQPQEEIAVLRKLVSAIIVSY